MTHRAKSLSCSNAGIFIFWCALVYAVGYLMRYNFGASLIEIVRVGRLSRSRAGACVSGGFIAYGIGQLLGGWIGDRVRPPLLLSAGLAGSAMCNIFVAVLPGAAAMTAAWCVNGLFQSLLWPPLVRLMAETLTPAVFRRGTSYIFIASNAAAAAVYLLTPLCISLAGWQAIFFVCAGAGLVTACAFFLAAPGILRRSPRPEQAEQPANTPADPLPQRCTPLFFFAVVCICIVIHGIIRDGISTWLPTLVSETFDIATGRSIIIGIVPPLLACAGVGAASLLYRLVRGELQLSVLMFAVAAALSSAAALLYGQPAADVICLGVITACMTGVNLMLIGRLPVVFAQRGRVSMVSGIFNMFSHAGGAVSVWGIAGISRRWGWQSVIWIWAAAAAVGMILCLLGIAARRRQFN